MGEGWRRGLPFLAAAGVLVAAAALWVPLDVDGDGASSLEELRRGTHPAAGDTDGDGLADGWEARHRLDPLAADADFDGLTDTLELFRRSDPLAPDTDRDRIPDDEEPDGADCDRDGFTAVSDGDDDGDRRVDGLEPEGQRCRHDTDGDGLPDGAEGHWTCVLSKDCDADGLPDAQENGTAFDPLDPDTFGAGTPDTVAWAFQESGQAPGTDADRDGIPDGWEPAGGLLAWGGLQPVAGQRDLLIEFLRVMGPDSGRFSYLDFTPAYQAVASTFLTERDVRVRWVETRVTLPAESDPPLLPTATDTYYAGVLAQGRHSANPYVTTVVMNPQHDQSEFLHLGVAPIRGVLAAVDYGYHTTVHFRSGEYSFGLSPLLESKVRGGRADLLAAEGFDSGRIIGDRIQLHTPEGFTFSWSPSWFRTPILVTSSSGGSLQFNLTGASVDTANLAATILHEVGHTLGLCHPDDPECNAGLAPADRAIQATSTMSYDAPPGTLHFLDSEWTTALTYLTCPPQGPLRALARGDSDAAVRAAKYAYANVNASEDVRACADFTAVPRQFQPDDPKGRTFSLPEDQREPRRATQSVSATYLYGLGGATAAVAAGLGVWAFQRHRRRGGDLHPPSGL